MNIRIGFSVIFSILVIALIVCSVISFKSHKRIGKAVGFVEVSLIPPVIGNLIIIGSSNQILSLIGCYIYFLGMDLVITALVNFTAKYCKGIGNSHHKPTIMYVILALDAVNILLNPFLGHAFTNEAVMVQDKAYYRAVPFIGLMIHRIIGYFIFFSVIMIFVVVVIKTAKIYRERYSIVLLSLVFVGIWQTFYIFSRTPVDRSMIGYGVIGILIFYLCLYYRPLRLLDRMLSNIASNMSEGLFVYDQFGKCIWANETGLKIVNLKKNDLDDVPEKLREKFGDRKFTTEDWTDKKVIGTNENASYYTIENHFVSEDSKHLAGSYLIIRDNTEEQRKLQQEIYNSTHDALTQLYTKQHCYECIRNKIIENKDNAKDYVIIFVDVKNFKIVNDIFGTEFGDKALISIAEWLRANVDDSCIYGRLAGDTFGVYMPKEKLDKDKEKVEKELLNFEVREGTIIHRLLIHVGVYEITEDDVDVSVMFDRAHLAISLISGNYKEHIAFYDNKLREKVVWDQKIAAELNEAINTRQIKPYLQPITDRTGKIVGAEALARWIHPKQGFMSPAVFIPVLEKNGLIYEVDRHIWRCACEILSEWKKQGKDMFLSVNISPKDFYYINIASEIKGLVEEFELEPEKLRIEITETVMMNDVDDKFKILDQLRKDGFIVEMDDFGSGFSSLNLLKDMPVDVLKIDMKFLSGSDGSNKATTIIRNIIKLSEDLNITSLTEGVETVEQYSELSDMGCKLFQGYYFAKPLPREEFETFAEKHNSSC